MSSLLSPVVRRAPIAPHALAPTCMRHPASITHRPLPRVNHTTMQHRQFYPSLRASHLATLALRIADRPPSSRTSKKPDCSPFCFPSRISSPTSPSLRFLLPRLYVPISRANRPSIDATPPGLLHPVVIGGVHKCKCTSLPASITEVLVHYAMSSKKPCQTEAEADASGRRAATCSGWDPTAHCW